VFEVAATGDDKILRGQFFAGGRQLIEVQADMAFTEFFRQQVSVRLQGRYFEILGKLLVNIIERMHWRKLTYCANNTVGAGGLAVVEDNYAGTEDFCLEEFEVLLTLDIPEEGDAPAQGNGVYPQYVFVDEIELHEPGNNAAAAENDYVEAVLLFEGFDLFTDVLFDDAGIAPFDGTQRAREYELGIIVHHVGIGAFQAPVCGIVGFVGPIAGHGLVGDAAEEYAIHPAQLLVGEGGHFMVPVGEMPVELAGWAGHVSIERYVYRDNQLSHQQGLLKTKLLCGDQAGSV
jgi:hypothetical protein